MKKREVLLIRVTKEEERTEYEIGANGKTSEIIEALSEIIYCLKNKGAIDTFDAIAALTMAIERAAAEGEKTNETN